MAEATVRDWVNEYRCLEPVEVYSFGNTIIENNDLIQALFTVLEEKRYHPEFLESACEQLFTFYRSREDNLQKFALHYIPCLIGLYLSQVSKGNRKSVRCVEVLLLGIYNLEVIDSNGQPNCVSFRIPSISKPSIYHEPISLSHSILTEESLSSLEYADSRKYTIGPHAEVEKINASNRLQVMTVLMWLYNQYIGNLSTFSHMSVCKSCTRLVKQGYNRSNRSNYSSDSSYGNPHPRPIARVPLSAPLLLEMVHSVYYAMFNGIASAGCQTLEEIHSRATHEMLAEVLLVTNAIRNSLRVLSQPIDGPMGISITLSPTTVISSAVSRAITNASFRTKKLPDDIPIQSSEETSENHQLSAINEEETAEPSPQLEKARVKKTSTSSNGSTGTPNPSKTSVLQLRKDKNKDKKKDAGHVDSNGSSKHSPLPMSNSAHANIGLRDSNSEDSQLSRYANADHAALRNSYPYKMESITKNSVFTSDTSSRNNVDDHIFDRKVSNNFSNPDMASDIKFVLPLGVHKSESANGIQSSSMQTAV